MKYRYHLFEDGGFAARCLVTRPGIAFRLDLWVSDVGAFIGGQDVPETSVDRWLQRIVAGIHATQTPAYIFITSPTTQPHAYFLPPDNPTENGKD